ncbi:predicted protein [Micromonas commoda]|uniref:Cytochrome b5 heme-binding domain-containing protein n=1 Tax=Micromonas commoda (strain RCC299 / NOUM17 / CCMP2709) TaxID=296587 RepID=C1ECQ4_MICCC|nr:predicted protein [Micromonas commoda]ACO65945.1 predicted protein [Micromonas commoda]|eukprot:XP_002504687.1 predicted protein [Micromonas commoda]
MSTLASMRCLAATSTSGRPHERTTSSSAGAPGRTTNARRHPIVGDGLLRRLSRATIAVGSAAALALTDPSPVFALGIIDAFAPVPPRAVTFEEVAAHDAPEACYMGLAIGRRTLDDSIVVYDMTGFLSRHPGGYERVARNCGTVNCAWEMRYKGHRFFALDDSRLGFAVRARGGVALGTLTEYSNGSCLE